MSNDKNMSAADVLAVLEGPAERVHDGWDGRSQPMYRLQSPCGCRASAVTGYGYYICTDHLRIAQQQARAALARVGGGK